jgi:hypothetical protein
MVTEDNHRSWGLSAPAAANEEALVHRLDHLDSPELAGLPSWSSAPMRDRQRRMA